MKTSISDKKQFLVYTSAGLGAAIRHFRRQAGLTQAELAERAGLHRSYLSSLEKGRETEHLRRLLRVLKHLDVRISIDPAVR